MLLLDTTFAAPLVYIDPKDNVHSIATVVGIVSWVAACGDVNYPDIYARVTHALQWILDKTGRLVYIHYINIYLSDYSIEKNITFHLAKFYFKVNYIVTI